MRKFQGLTVLVWKPLKVSEAEVAAPDDWTPAKDTARGENGGRVLQSLPAAVKVQRRRGQPH